MASFVRTGQQQAIAAWVEGNVDYASGCHLPCSARFILPFHMPHFGAGLPKCSRLRCAQGRAAACPLPALEHVFADPAAQGWPPQQCL